MDFGHGDQVALMLVRQFGSWQCAVKHCCLAFADKLTGCPTRLPTANRTLPAFFTLLLAANCSLPTANCQPASAGKLPTEPCQEVIGYYPSWKWYDRDHLVSPATIDYTKYTAINYAFLEPRPDGSVTLFDPAVDRLLLLGSATSPSLVEMAHRHGTRVFASVGGWTLSQHFPGIAASAEKRSRFANSCAELVQRFGLDGIDLDWEYPGYQPQGGGPDDRRNFTLLLRETRLALNALQPQLGRPLFLTAAFGCSPNRMADIEWEEVTPLLDFLNLMAYDFYGRDFAVTNHHAPLYPPAKGIEGYDAHSTVHRLIDGYRVPPEKICLGVPFYGRSLRTRSQPGLHVGSTQAADARTFPEDDGAPEFYNIEARQQQFRYHWDSLAQAPFLLRHSSNTFVSFDDERSVARKGRYIREHGLAGAVVWDITGDCVESRQRPGTIERTPLADALKSALCGDWPAQIAMDRPAATEPLPALPCRVRSPRFSPRVSVPAFLPKGKKKKRWWRRKG
jgi:chitinase